MRYAVTKESLFRLGGLALLIAFPIQLIGFVLHPPSEEVVDVLKGTYRVAHLVLWVSWLFAALGLPAMFAFQAARSGVLGIVAFVSTIFAAAYHFYLLLYEAYATTLLAQNPATRDLIADGPLAHGAGALGPVGLASVLAFPLLGIATLRAGVFPRGAGWLLIVSLLLFVGGAFVVSPDEPAPLGTSATAPIAWLYFAAFAGLAWCGWTLWMRPAAARATGAAVIEAADRSAPPG